MHEGVIGWRLVRNEWVLDLLAELITTRHGVVEDRMQDEEQPHCIILLASRDDSRR